MGIQQKIPVNVTHWPAMPPQLAKVVSRGIPNAPTTATFLKIKQGNLNSRTFVFRELDPDKQVLRIAAAMLPACTVNARERRTQLSENSAMYRNAQLVRGSAFIPSIQTDKTSLQCFGDKQCSPLPTLLSRPAIDDARHLYANTLKGLVS